MNNENSYKQQVIEQAKLGFMQGGLPAESAYVFSILLERVYDCGYNEAVRNLRSDYDNRN